MMLMLRGPSQGGLLQARLFLALPTGLGSKASLPRLGLRVGSKISLQRGQVSERKEKMWDSGRREDI